MRNNLEIQQRTTCTMAVNESKHGPYDTKGLMGNAALYRRLLQALIEHGWKRFLKKHSNPEDFEIVSLLISVYNFKHNAEKRMSMARVMLKNHRKKIKKDMKMYMENTKVMVYPPNHEIHTQKKLFPFLDKKMSEIFVSVTFPRSVPSDILYEALQNINPKILYNINMLQNYFNHLKSQSVKWLAMKLLPIAYHSHIRCAYSIISILERISLKEKIRIDALIILVKIRYRKIRSELFAIHGEQQKMYTGECESPDDNDGEIGYSQVSVASDVSMNEVNYPSMELMNDEMTEEKFIIESDVCDVEMTAKDSASDGAGIISNDESVYSMEYLEDNITTDVPMGEAAYPSMEPMNNEISESDVYGAQINENNSVDDCASILSNDESVYPTEYLEDTVATDVSIEEIDNSPQEQTNDGIVEENTEIEPSTFNEKNIFGNGTMNHFHHDDNSNPHNNQEVDGTSSQIHESSLNKRRLMFKTIRSMNGWLHNSLVRRTRVIKMMKNKTRMVGMKMKKLIAKHEKLQELMSKEMQMIKSVAMMKQRHLLMLMDNL